MFFYVDSVGKIESVEMPTGPFLQQQVPTVKKMNTKTPVVVHDAFIANALRNCGYNTYTAIADIIDNAIEPEVGSTEIRVIPEYEGNGAKATITALNIIDNGCGMTMATLQEAMALGSDTGKNATDNLGLYGAGLKTASFSMGTTLEVYSSQNTSEEVNYACFSIANAIKNGGKIEIEYESRHFDQTPLQIQEKLNAGHGTVVRISNVDRLASSNYKTFVGTALKQLSICFNKYLSDDSEIKMFVGNERVPFVDAAKENQFAELWESSEDVDDKGNPNVIIIDGHHIRYRVWYSPKVTDDDERSVDDKIVLHNGANYLERQERNQGFYIYRQNRLVGKALTFDVWNRHNSLNGLHIELFLDGSCDYLVGSTFTKMLNEHSNLADSLKSILKARFDSFVRQAKKRNAQNSPLTDEEKKRQNAFYEHVTDLQNGKATLAMHTNGTNSPKKDPFKEHESRGPQKNPNPIRIRKSSWLGGFREIPMGALGEMYTYSRQNGKSIVEINTDHPFYREFYSKLDVSQKTIMAQIISCNVIALNDVGYNDDDDKRDLLNEFLCSQANAVRKSLS